MNTCRATVAHHIGDWIATLTTFDDLTIRQLFGTDAAEDDDPTRLKAYFFKNQSYSNIRADLPLRILVGHKGIGKSALLKISHLQDIEDGILSISVQPNNLIVKNSASLSFIEKIDAYKARIISAIERKALDTLSIFGDDPRLAGLETSAKKLMHGLLAKALGYIDLNIDDETARLRKSFQENQKIRVYIDDLDRGWSASKDDINNISALINAARDLTNEDNRVQIRIGLRSDAYYLYRTSDESTDKIESNVVRLNWNRHEILTVMALRVAHYFGKGIDPEEFSRRNQSEIARELHPIIEPKFSVGKGHWDGAPIHTVLLSLNRNRPRDLIKLLTQAAQEAFRHGNNVITATDVQNVFSDYSHGRITDLILEFKSELPEIEKLILNMKPSGNQVKEKERRWLYTIDDLHNKLRSIMSNHNLRFTSGHATSTKSLAEFLYKIDFILARNTNDEGRATWTHFDQNRLLSSQVADFGYKWEVHPAYRWALQPKSVLEILETISLTD